MKWSIRVDAEELSRILAEKARLHARVDELLADNTRQVELRRAAERELAVLRQANADWRRPRGA